MKTGLIYKIECNITKEIYIGSTFEPTVAKRIVHHRLKTNQCSSKQIIERGDYIYGLCETVIVNSRDELRMKEREWFDKTDCINIRKPFRSKGEIDAYYAAYRADNKEEIDANAAAYYANNKEHMAAKNAAYYANNKDKIAAYYAANYAANKEQIAAKNAANKDKIAAKNAAYYAKKKAAANTDPI